MGKITGNYQNLPPDPEDLIAEFCEYTGCSQAEMQRILACRDRAERNAALSATMRQRGFRGPVEMCARTGYRLARLNILFGAPAILP